MRTADGCTSRLSPLCAAALRMALCKAVRMALAERQMLPGGAYVFTTLPVWHPLGNGTISYLSL